MKRLFKRIWLNSKKNDKAFSLVEVLCAIVLLALVATPILQAIFSSLNMNLKSRKLLAAADITSGVMEFTSSLVFEDYTYGTPTKTVYGMKNYYWCGEANAISANKLATLSSPVLYPHGPSCEYTGLSGDATTRTLKAENVIMDGFKFDVEIEITDPESSESYFCYPVSVKVMEHGQTKVLSSAQTMIANAY